MTTPFCHRFFLIALGLLSLAACKKESSDQSGLGYVGGLPYYHFTAADRLWFQAASGTEWQFENSQGMRRSCRLTAWQSLQKESRITTYGILSNGYKVVGFHDEAQLTLSSTDTSPLGFSGKLWFYRDALGQRPNQPIVGPSQFYAEGEWEPFIGNIDENSANYSCAGMQFPVGKDLNGPFTTLTVRGKQYAEVVTFVATRRASGCTPFTATSLRELYYDRQAGMVRMVRYNGEVWDRVP